MSIKVKAIETDLSHFSDKDGKSLGFRFVLKPELDRRSEDRPLPGHPQLGREGLAVSVEVEQEKIDALHRKGLKTPTHTK